MRKRQLMGLTLVIVLVLTVLVVASCGSSTTTTTGAPATTATTAAPATTTSGGGAIDAAALYATDCAGCHKSIPEGDAATIKSVTESGKESMPGFKDKLSADQITALVNYVTSGGQE